MSRVYLKGIWNKLDSKNSIKIRICTYRINQWQTAINGSSANFFFLSLTLNVFSLGKSRLILTIVFWRTKYILCLTLYNFAEEISNRESRPGIQLFLDLWIKKLHFYPWRRENFSFSFNDCSVAHLGNEFQKQKKFKSIFNWLNLQTECKSSLTGDRE